MMASRTFIQNIQTWIQLGTILTILPQTFGSIVHTRLTDFEGIVESPGYPNLYPSNHWQLWEIRVFPGLLIKLEFVSLSLEDHDCGYDYVRIFNGERNSSLVGTFCGTRMPPTIISLTNVIHIELKTDDSVSLTGFLATYETTLDGIPFVPNETKRKLTQYFLTTVRKRILSNNKWDSDITRSSVALFLHDSSFFRAGNDIGEEIAYELSLQLMSKLVMRKRISSNDLASFINAMTVACINPKNFFGVNIVEELHKRIKSTNHTNPFFILAICNAGVSIETEYVYKLQLLFDAPLKPSWTRTQALIVMALKCISRQNGLNLDNILENLVTKLKRKQNNNGTIENVKTTALVIQALLAIDRDDTGFDFVKAIKYILDDIEDKHLSTEEVYYVLPIFKPNSLLNVNSIHCEKFYKTDLEGVKSLLPEKTHERMNVQISIIIGDYMDFSRTWRINVPSNCTLYQALENVSYSEPDYKVQYTFINDKPFVAALSRFEDSVENFLFWFIYRKPRSSTGDLVRLEESPVDIWVNADEEYVLWYNSGSPPTTQPVESDTTVEDALLDTTSTETIMSTTL